MPDWTQHVRPRLSGLRLSPTREAEIVEELSQHLEDRYRELIASGMSPDEATREALADFREGDLLARHMAPLRQANTLAPITPGAPGGHLFSDLWQDLRYAARGLFRSPGFTLVSVVSLALAVGVTTGIFGIIDAVFLDAVSARNVGQLRHIEPGASAVSYPYYRYLSSANSPAILGLAAYIQSRLSFRTGDDVESVTGDIVSPNFFSVLGLTPSIGRGFSIDEQQPEREPEVVIVSHTFWKRKYDANTNIIGKVINLNRESFTVIGVLPKDYRSIHGYGMAPDIYVPFSRRLMGDLDDPSLGTLQLIARVQDGVSISQLKFTLGTLVQGWRQVYPTDRRYSDKVEVYPLTGIEKMRRDGVPLELTVFLALLILTAVLVLLIACANVAGLLVARGMNRAREIAIRLALGAARSRLIQQLLTESALLAFLGVCVGVIFYLAMATMVANLQIRASAPFELHLRLDRPLLYLCIGLVAITTLLSGLVPALQTSRDRCRLGSNIIGEETHQRAWFRRALVVGQFALSFVLLISATLFLRGLAKNSRVDPGFDVQHLLTAEVTLDKSSYSPIRAEQYFERAIVEIRRLPGVRSVSGVTVVPLGLERWAMSMDAGEHEVQMVYATRVTPGYFGTMKIPFLQGRDFQADDRANVAPVMIVNETVAKTYFNNNALGGLVRLPIPGNSPIKIIGVVRDSKYGTLGEKPMPAVYLPISQDDRALTLAVSTDTAPAGTLTAVRQLLASLDPRAPIKIELMQERLDGALLPSKIAFLLLGGTGALGLLLATIGVYGVMAYSVARRTAEIGIRMALGSTRIQVLRLILKDAAKLVCIGIVVGSIPALFVVQALAEALPAGMKVVDPLSFATIGGILAIVALIAAFVPAWKGSQLDPNIALRSE
ncbi:MAG: ABC transporter permease [Chloracidobacterium sp.]|nr:ABC transporter permease [Chloracidobacterium sp.]